MPPVAGSTSRLVARAWSRAWWRGWLRAWSWICGCTVGSVGPCAACAGVEGNVPKTLSVRVS